MESLSFPAVSTEALPRVPVSAPPPQVVPARVDLPEDLRPFEVPDHLNIRREPDRQKSEPREPRKKDLEGQLENLNKIMEGLGNRLDFGLYQGTDELFVRVVDRRTNKVVKVLPPEKLLQLHAKLDKAFGLILDEEV